MLTWPVTALSIVGLARDVNGIFSKQTQAQIPLASNSISRTSGIHQERRSKLLITGMIRSLGEIKESVHETIFHDWCKNLDVEVVILVGQENASWDPFGWQNGKLTCGDVVGNKDTTSQLRQVVRGGVLGKEDATSPEDTRALDCLTPCPVHLITEQSLPSGPEVEGWPLRVKRTALARQQQRETILRRLTGKSDGNSTFYGEALNAYSALVSVDLDVNALPDSHALAAAAAELDQPEVVKPELVCANGVKRSSPRSWWDPFGWFSVSACQEISACQIFYDTYPLVLLNGTWGYPWQPQEQAGFYEKLLEYHDKGHRSTSYPVSSCYGGMALYNFRMWASTSCRFGHSPNTNYDENNATELIWIEELHKYAVSEADVACEHLVFNHCLQKKGALKTAIIKADLTVEAHS